MAALYSLIGHLGRVLKYPAERPLAKRPLDATLNQHILGVKVKGGKLRP